MPTDQPTSTVHGNQPNTLLRGGPGRADEVADRYCRTDEAASTLKVRNGNCYDHFRVEPDPVLDGQGRSLRVFTWSHRTYVAE
ncbi:DUF5988 family protein [Micromonospora sp. NPDC023956]|uniref:DUF5988 family protein n=1 Tax=Micromonospora sp. NPDC023956 TaxID=3155722 RepID=UPI0033D9759E